MRRPKSLATLFAFTLTSFVQVASAAALLGATLAPLALETKVKYGSGVLITATAPGSPAAQAGLKPGEIIVSADGFGLGEPDDLIQIVNGHKAGESVTLVVVNTAKGYNARKVNVRVTASPPDAKKDDGIYHGFDDFKPGGAVLKDDYKDDMDQFDDGKGATPPRPAARPTRSAIPVQVLASQFCRALAPAGWAITDQDAQGATLTLTSSDQRMKAAYAVMPVNGGAAQGYYGPQMQTPAGVALHVASLLANGPLQVTGVQNFLGAQVETFRGAGAIGFVLYRAYPVPGDFYGGYVLSMRIAMGPSQHEEGIAGAVAAAIRCTTQFHAPAGGYAQVQPRSADRATGTSAKCQSGNCDEGDLAGTYNVQLGTGYVHSETGQNFIVDPATDYHQTGPEGPGYYVTVGNSLQKAEPGWSE